MTIQLLLLIVALVLFVISACNVPSRINLVSAGLALCVAAVIAGALHGG